MYNEETDFTPVKILKVYKGGSDKYYIEIHPVYQIQSGESKGDYRIGAGMPITKKTMQNLLGATMSSDDKTNLWEYPIMPECLLSFCAEKYKRHIIWWRPRRFVEMIFSPQVKLKSGPISMPAMLFFSHLDKIKIFALKENKRPTLRSVLYQAPLLNSITGNEMCWGNVSNNIHDIMEIDNEIDTWENYLWNSIFTHAGSAKATKNDIISVYKDLIETKKSFPTKELIKTDLIVNNLIGEI